MERTALWDAAVSGVWGLCQNFQARKFEGTDEKARQAEVEGDARLRTREKLNRGDSCCL